MATTSKKLQDGTLERTETSPSVETITILTPEQLAKERTEAQTVVDHLKLKLTTAEAVVAACDKEIAKLA